VDGSARLDADADSDGQARTGGSETGSVSPAVADDVAELDSDGDGGESEPVGFGDIDPELIRMVNKAIIEQLSGE
jgi:hypothetical protein